MASRTARRVGALLVVITILASWLISGVAVGEAARFVLFEVAYTILPGCLLYLLLDTTPRGRLRTLAIGWPLGYAVEVAVFALTAALGWRSAFGLLPAIGVLALAALLSSAAGRARARTLLPSRAERGGARGASDSGAAETLFAAVAISAALTLLALKLFTINPLPGHFHSVAYGIEEIFPIALAAEARSHWPMTSPWVAGYPLRYYTAVFIHGAAVGQVAGVSLPTLYFRLFPTTATLLVAIQLCSLGRTIGRARLAGPLAVFLFFLARAITLSPSQLLPFESNTLEDFWGVPTMMFGAMFLLALFAAAEQWLIGDGAFPPAAAKPGGETSKRGIEARGAVIVSVLLLGCAAAKMFAAVDFVGGLGLFWLWSLARGRGSPALSRALAISLACIVVVYFAMLAGGSAKVMSYHLLNTELLGSLSARAREPVQAVVGHTGLWPLLVAVAAIVMALLLLAPVFGAAWLLLRRSRLLPIETFYVAVLLAGLLCYYVTIGTVGGADIYFRFYGFVALVLLAAGGLADLWQEAPRQTQQAILTGCAVVLAVGLGVVVVAGLAPRAHRTLAYAGAYAVTACVVVLLAVRLRAHFAALVPSRWASGLACCIPLLGVLCLVRPIVFASERASAALGHRRIAAVDSPLAYGMTSSLYQGLAWVRSHTRACNVLAVNNYYGSADPKGHSAYLVYSAFTERRIFLESWSYTTTGLVDTHPFASRIALNNSAVLQGDPAALRELARQGVSYVLIDKTHGTGAPEPDGAAQLVFDNGALEVYRLRTDPGLRPGLGCPAQGAG